MGTYYKTQAHLLICCSHTDPYVPLSLQPFWLSFITYWNIRTQNSICSARCVESSLHPGSLPWYLMDKNNHSFWTLTASFSLLCHLKMPPHIILCLCLESLTNKLFSRWRVISYWIELALSKVLVNICFYFLSCWQNENAGYKEEPYTQTNLLKE